MEEEIRNIDEISRTTLGVPAPRPSSPREFFARIYGHLEQNNKQTEQIAPVRCDSSSSSDVEIEDREDVNDERKLCESLPPVWTPAPMPVCPRPLLLPHQQLAFGAGLAAFCKYFLHKLCLKKLNLNI